MYLRNNYYGYGFFMNGFIVLDIISLNNYIDSFLTILLVRLGHRARWNK